MSTQPACGGLASAGAVPPAEMSRALKPSVEPFGRVKLQLEKVPPARALAGVMISWAAAVTGFTASQEPMMPPLTPAANPFMTSWMVSDPTATYVVAGSAAAGPAAAIPIPARPSVTVPTTARLLSLAVRRPSHPDMPFLRGLGLMTIPLSSSPGRTLGYAQLVPAAMYWTGWVCLGRHSTADQACVGGVPRPFGYGTPLRPALTGACAVASAAPVRNAARRRALRTPLRRARPRAGPSGCRLPPAAA